MAGSGRATDLSGSQPVGPVLTTVLSRSMRRLSHEPEPSCPEMGGHAETNSSLVWWVVPSSSSYQSLRVAKLLKNPLLVSCHGSSRWKYTSEIDGHVVGHIVDSDEEKHWAKIAIDRMMAKGLA